MPSDAETESRALADRLGVGVRIDACPGHSVCPTIVLGKSTFKELSGHPFFDAEDAWACALTLLGAIDAIAKQRAQGERGRAERAERERDEARAMACDMERERDAALDEAEHYGSLL